MKHISRMAMVFTMGIFFAGFALSGCVTKAQSGAGLGALGGGLLGSLAGPAKNREQNALIGAAVGGLFGYAIGNEMDKEDLAHVNSAYEKVPDNQSFSWDNPNSKRRYTVTPRSTTQDSSGRHCRQAEIASIIDGKRETVVKMACRRGNGTWEL